MPSRYKPLFAVLLMALAFNLSGCVGGFVEFGDEEDPNRDYFDKTGKPPTPPNLAHLKIQRSSNMADGARQARIGVNNMLAAYLWPGETFEGDFYPGMMNITADVEGMPGYSAIQINATPNASYEIRVSPTGSERASTANSRTTQYGGSFQLEMVSIAPSAPSGTLTHQPSQTPTYVPNAPVYAPYPQQQPQPQPQLYPPQPQPYPPQQQYPQPYPQQQSPLPMRQ